MVQCFLIIPGIVITIPKIATRHCAPTCFNVVHHVEIDMICGEVIVGFIGIKAGVAVCVQIKQVATAFQANYVTILFPITLIDVLDRLDREVLVSDGIWCSESPDAEAEPARRLGIGLLQMEAKPNVSSALIFKRVENPIFTWATCDVKSYRIVVIHGNLLNYTLSMC